MAYTVVNPLTTATLDLIDASTGVKAVYLPLLLIDLRIQRNVTTRPYLYYKGTWNPKRYVWLSRTPAGARVSLFGFFQDVTSGGKVTMTALQNFQNLMQKVATDDDVFDTTSSNPKYFTIKLDVHDSTVKLYFQHCLIETLDLRKDPATQVWACNLSFSSGRIANKATS